MPCCLVLVLAGVLAAGVRLQADEAPSPDHAVRAADAGLRASLTTGATRSRTFRRLLDDLTRSDVIVHVERAETRQRTAGVTRFAVAAAGRRFVRISLNVARMDDEAVALLAHELRHAREVADAPAVVDAASHRGLYSRIGFRSGGENCFESRAALRVGSRVLSELRANASPWLPPWPHEPWGERASRE